MRLRIRDRRFAIGEQPFATSPKRMRQENACVRMRRSRTVPQDSHSALERLRDVLRVMQQKSLPREVERARL